MKKFLVFSLSVAALAAAVMAYALASVGSAAAGRACPSARFPELAQTATAGAGYAVPRFSAKCSSTELIVTSNGIIGYRFVAKTPNPLRAQNWTWKVPRIPKVAAKMTSIANVLGTLGFTVTGLPIFGPTEGPIPTNQAFGDPVYNGILDGCGGHTGPGADYHNHALNTVAACNLKKRAVIGYALDGFPIYGRVGCLDRTCTKTATMTSGYVKTGNPVSNSWSAYTYRARARATVLDKCNGRVEPDGTYGYHATASFPYIIGCYRGTPTPQTGNAGAPMPPM